MSVSLYIDFLKSKGLVVCKTESKVHGLDINIQHQYKPVTFTGVLQHQRQHNWFQKDKNKTRPLSISIIYEALSA